ncbi:MAG: RsmD family RNA methyltransferase [Candidatus Saccharimonadales bacterium]
MRIIAGALGGRIFAAPDNRATHPMSQKARGGLFNALGDIAGLTFLDAFGGSGALAFEAISRGAASAQIIENDRAAANVIAASIAKLQLQAQIKLAKTSAATWLKTHPNDFFDIILCDPPYDKPGYNLLATIAARAKPAGLIILSLPPKTMFHLPTSSFQLLPSKTYGDAELSFYRR